jgi:hypothetical protein
MALKNMLSNIGRKFVKGLSAKPASEVISD